MNTIIMNSENSETSDPRRLLFKFIDNIALRRKKDKFIALSNLGKMEKYKNTWKNIKKTYKNKTFKYLLQHGMKNLNYLIIFYIRYSRLFWIHI